MSFITLQSSRNEMSPQSLDASYFRNDFKNGILVKPGDTMSLVNLTINTLSEFIVNANNDTMVFRLGNRQSFTQVVARITHGSYSGDELAEQVVIALNDAVIGGVWKNGDSTTVPGVKFGFICQYDNTDPTVDPKFFINLIQQTQPVENLSDKKPWQIITNSVAGSINEPSSCPLQTTIVQPGATQHYHVEGVNILGNDSSRLGCPDQENNFYSALDIGERGIFLNGGSNVIECHPVKGIDTTSVANALGAFTNLFETGGGGITGNNWAVESTPNSAGPAPEWLTDNTGAVPETTVDCNVNVAPGTAWDLKITFVHDIVKNLVAGTRTSDFYLAYRGCIAPGQQNGMFVMGTDPGADPTLSASWDAPIPYWWWDGVSAIVGSDQAVAARERYSFGSPQSLISHILKPKDLAKLITASLVTCAGYNQVRLGYFRQQFYYADQTTPDTALNESETGGDASITISPAANQLIPNLTCSRIVAKVGAAGIFGRPQWRDGFGSGDIEFPGLGQTPSVNSAGIFAGAFAPGDRLKIGLEIVALRSYALFIEMSKEATPDTWINRVNLLSVGRTTTPAALVTATSSIRQNQWNLRPYYAYGAGGFYDPAKYVVKGINDISAYRDSGSAPLYSGSLLPTIDEGEGEGEEEEEVGSTITQSGIITTPDPLDALSCLFKFGRVQSGEMTNDEDMVPNIANIADLLGMPRFKQAVSLSTMFNIESDSNPTGAVGELNMMVCLEDFNISGKNGKTGDDVKIICVVPKEQLAISDSNKNVLHYTANFPIPIDINPSNEQTYYSLTASLRDLDGKFITSLEDATTITLLHERDKDNKQAQAIANAMRNMNELRSNEQSNIITNAGMDNPRV